MELQNRFQPYLGLLLLLTGPACIIGGLWRELESRTRQVNGPGGTFTLLTPSIPTLPPWTLWLARIGLLLALCGLVLPAVRSGSTGRMGTIRHDSWSNKV